MRSKSPSPQFSISKNSSSFSSIDPDEWRPLIMSFQRFYGLTGEQAGGSRLAEIPEESYRRNGRPPVGATRSH